MKKMNITYNQMLNYAETNDACTDYYKDANMYYIYYNDIAPNIVKSNRYRWNIAHELGHVLLRHHINNDKTRIFRNSLSTDEYNILILSTNCELYVKYLILHLKDAIMNIWTGNHI